VGESQARPKACPSRQEDILQGRRPSNLDGTAAQARKPNGQECKNFVGVYTKAAQDAGTRARMIRWSGVPVRKAISWQSEAVRKFDLETIRTVR